MNIYDSVTNPEFDTEGSILVLDISNSTKMKEESEEVSWLGNYAKAFDVIVSEIPESGHVVKYLGDGLMLYFDEDQQTDAINSAIRVQENIEKLNEQNVINCMFSVGLASGRFKKIPINNEKYDYLGQVVDRAFRLCSAAMPKGIFVDMETVGAANITRISSEVGSVLRRTPTDYVGKPEAIPLKGFGKLVDFHEIFWGRDRYGVKTSHSTPMPPMTRDSVEEKRVEEQPVEEQRFAGSRRMTSGSLKGSYKGRFTEWRGNCGRVQGDDGTLYFMHKGSVLDGFELTGGEEVFFVVRPTTQQLDKADAVIPIGAKLEGKVVNINGGNCFLSVSELEREGHDNVYCWIGDAESDPFEIGDYCEFSLTKGFNKQKQRYTMRAYLILETDRFRPMDSGTDISGVKFLQQESAPN